MIRYEQNIFPLEKESLFEVELIPIFIQPLISINDAVRDEYKTEKCILRVIVKPNFAKKIYLYNHSKNPKLSHYNLYYKNGKNKEIRADSIYKLIHK